MTILYCQRLFKIEHLVSSCAITTSPKDVTCHSIFNAFQMVSLEDNICLSANKKTIAFVASPWCLIGFLVVYIFYLDVEIFAFVY